MTVHYSLYGLSVAADVPVPGLVALTSAPARIDVQWFLDSPPPSAAETPAESRKARYTSPTLDSRGFPSLAVWETVSGSHYCLAYADETIFWVERTGTRVWATWPEGSTIEDTATYLLGPVMGFVLRLRGVACLHASAVVIAERAVALMGPPGAGKSTTAAAFARRGFSVLSDDIAPLAEAEGDFLVQPGYPRLCLWPDAATALYGSPGVLPPLTPSWEKRYVDLASDGYQFQQYSLRLGAIYLLDEPHSDLQAPRFEPIRPVDAVMSLVANTYMNYLLDAEQRAREFQILARLVSAVPVRRVLPQLEPRRAEQLSQAILSDFQSPR